MRYTDPAPRDARLDLLRGYAVFAMGINHFGMEGSLTRYITGGSVFLINAAEVFFFVSGLTLGIISQRKAPATAMGRCFRRAWQVHLAVLFLAMGSLVLESPGELDDGVWQYVGGVLTLQNAPFWGDVLVAYVLYLLLVPALIAMLAQGRSKLALGVVFGIYALSQLDPSGLALPFASFRNLAANAPLFFGALILGWHRDAVSRWWHSRSWSALIDGLSVLIALVLLVSYATHYALTPGIAAFMESRFDLGVREYQMPPLALLVICVYLRTLWLLVDRCWSLLHAAIGWFALPLGRMALTGYVAHAFLISIFWWLLGSTGLAESSEGSVIWASVISLCFGAAMLGVVQSAARVKAVVAHMGRRGEIIARVGPVGVVAGCLAIASAGISFNIGTEHKEDGASAWAGAIEESLYEQLAAFDTDRAPLIVSVVETYEEEEADGVFADHEGLAERLIEIMEDEGVIERRAEDGGAVRVAIESDTGGVTIEQEWLDELMNDAFAEWVEAGVTSAIVRDASEADVVLVVSALDLDTLEDEDASGMGAELERARGVFSAVRAGNAEAVLVLATALIE